jgi:phage repressor protein C with HTH and peptisase S24 domain
MSSVISYFLKKFMGEIESRFVQCFEVLENQGIIQSRSSFASEVGYAPSTLTEILKGRTKVNPYLIKHFCKKFNVSLEWIISGEGNMFLPIPIEEKPYRSNSPQTGQYSSSHYIVNAQEPEASWQNVKQATSLEDKSIREFPYLPIRARATFAEFFDDTEHSPFETKKVIGFEGKSYDGGVVIEIDGDSMEPQLRHGMEVLAMPVNLADLEYKTGGVYAVLFDTSFVIKRIAHNSIIEKRILLKSDNPTGGSFDVPYSKIRALWHVVDIVKGKVF